jgi:diguanylate cyclase (GGDEF)-like protein
MDTAVIAVHVDALTVIANAAARRMFALSDRDLTSVDELTARVRLLNAHDLAPLGVDDLPLMQALSGERTEAEVVLAESDGRRPEVDHDAARPDDLRTGAEDAVRADGHRPDIGRTDGADRTDRAGETSRAGPGTRRLLLRARPMTDRDGAVVGSVCTAQDLTDVHTLHTRNALLTRRAAELTALNQATRSLLKEEDARRVVCEIAQTVSNAVLACLFEPDGGGLLLCTTQVGADLQGLRLPQDGRSMAAEVFASGTTRVLIGSARTHVPDQAALDGAAARAGVQLRSAVWMPVISRGRTIAVLVLAFGGAVAVREQLQVLEILAAETAVAIERQDLLGRLRREAASDPLTGAANRRTWDEELPRALERSRSSGEALSAVMLDLDWFKRYNDTFGHPAGDALLQDAVAAWRQRLRPSDLLCRYGGEEFAILLPGCNAPDAARLAEQLRRVVPERQTCSAGVAGWDGREDEESLVQRMDAALYRAKVDGRNRVCIADPLL